MQQPIWKRETEIAEAISTNLLVTACVGWAPFGARSLPEKERQQQQQAHEWVKDPQKGRSRLPSPCEGDPAGYELSCLQEHPKYLPRLRATRPVGQGRKPYARVGESQLKKRRTCHLLAMVTAKAGREFRPLPSPTRLPSTGCSLNVGSYVAGLKPCLWSGQSHPSYPIRTEYFICVANIACWIIFSKQRASDVVHLYEHFIERQRYGRWLLGKHASWLKGDKSRFLTVFFTFLQKLRLWNN